MVEFTCVHRGVWSAGEWCPTCYDAANGKGRLVPWCMRHDRMASELPTGQIACSGIFEDGKPCYVFEALLTVWTRSPVFEYDELVEVDGVEGV